MNTSHSLKLFKCNIKEEKELQKSKRLLTKAYTKAMKITSGHIHVVLFYLDYVLAILHLLVKEHFFLLTSIMT